ncbi:hypothetical protein OG203_31430 [Nocardia sp. NBC_01499]|uniref:hypothetical protein n=1 Tax=Nocardia sp. NBC_01499 TaxID=2903597 RepID=UPI003867D46B
MTYLQEWEQKLERDLDEIRSITAKLNTAMAAIRGRSDAHGVTIEVNTAGDITSLQIAPGAMRWPSTQLTNTLLDCHRRARTDAATKTEKLLRSADPRLRAGIHGFPGEFQRGFLVNFSVVGVVRVPNCW